MSEGKSRTLSEIVFTSSLNFELILSYDATHTSLEYGLFVNRISFVRVFLAALNNLTIVGPIQLPISIAHLIHHTQLFLKLNKLMP